MTVDFIKTTQLLNWPGLVAQMSAMSVAPLCPFMLESVQTYMPIYDTLFRLTPKNHQHVTLRNQWMLHRILGDAEFSDAGDSSVCSDGGSASSSTASGTRSSSGGSATRTHTTLDEDGADPDDDRIGYVCSCVVASDTNPNHQQTRNVYFKMAELLDPRHYLVGKYEDLQPGPPTNPTCPSSTHRPLPAPPVFHLPEFGRHCTDSNAIIQDIHNAAYVDGLFAHLSGKLHDMYQFVHGVQCFGTFLGIHRHHRVNIVHDLDYLCASPHFVAGQNVRYVPTELCQVQIDAWLETLAANRASRDAARADAARTSAVNMTAEEDAQWLASLGEIGAATGSTAAAAAPTLSESWLAHHRGPHGNRRPATGAGTGRSMSTRSSQTCMSATGEAVAHVNHRNSGESDVSSSSMDDEEFSAMVTIPHFPVQVIAMEMCEETLDDLLWEGALTDEEWKSALFQIFATLWMYQHAFQFTHNDLHTNNIMCVTTEKTHFRYVLGGVTYTVPTYGRCYKLIDFGRSMFQWNGQTYASNAFQKTGDAYQQYNCEPFYDASKPRVDANFSFDVGLLASVVFSEIMYDSQTDVLHTSPHDPFIRDNALRSFIAELCMDDQGTNLAFKSDGTDRYSKFKLYIMMARRMHMHTPDRVLSHSFFQAYRVAKLPRVRGAAPRIHTMNLDQMVAGVLGASC